MKKLSNEAGCPSTRAKRLAIDNCHRKLVVELRLNGINSPSKEAPFYSCFACIDTMLDVLETSLK